MKVKPNRAFAQFRGRAKEVLLAPWKGTIFRVTTLKYRDPRIIVFGEGSYRHGGRWNAIESFRAVYGSTDPVTALSEIVATAQSANLPYPFREPRLVVAVEVSLGRVVDLTKPEMLELFGVSAKELGEEDWRKVQEQGFESTTQALGRAIFAAGGEGLIVCSARVENGINIAYFPKNRQRGSKVTICEAQQLRDLGLPN